MTGQAETFYRGEGNAWLKRNNKKIPIKDDLVLAALSELVGPLGNSILEIGCSNGWRLAEIKKRFKCTDLNGVDPSAGAITEAKKKGIEAIRGFAHNLPWLNESFDIVIYGHCLYLCDREDLFIVAKEGDRVLRDGGLMVIYDFATPHPCKKPYVHKEGLWSYHQPYDQMFLWNPAYSRLLDKYHTDGQTRVSILKKSIGRGWPPCESE